MKKLTLFVLLLTAASACSPLSVYYREGARVAQMERDLTGCEITALKQAPENIRTRYVPPVYSPYPFCPSHGHCYYKYRLTSPGYHKSYDANKPLREKITAQCMGGHGYAKVTIPQCGSAPPQESALAATRVFPPLTPESCAIRLKSGRFQILSSTR